MTRGARIAIPAVVAALVLGGCGSEDEVASDSTTTEATADGGPPSDLRREFEDHIRSILAARERDDLVDVACVIETLRATLPDRLVETASRAVAEREQIPQATVDAAFEAGRDCARR